MVIKDRKKIFDVGKLIKRNLLETTFEDYHKITRNLHSIAFFNRQPLLEKAM